MAGFVPTIKGFAAGMNGMDAQEELDTISE